MSEETINKKKNMKKITLKHEAQYDPEDVIYRSKCSCGKDLKFEDYPDAFENHYAAECSCGLTIRLSQESMFTCNIENENE